jgi:hypothetical protein
MLSSPHSVATCARLSCDPERAWEKVCFYEHIATRPSWLLRMVLPVPLETTGAYRKVGDTSRCLYSDGGFLTKRITRIVTGASIDFEIIEHTIRYARRIVLKGGTIQIIAHEDGTSSVRMITRYELTSPMLWIARGAIDKVVAMMHGVVMRDMQSRLAPADRPSNEAHPCEAEQVICE